MIMHGFVPVVAVALVLGVPAASLGGGAHTTLTSLGPDGPALGVSTYWRSLSANGGRAIFTSDDDGLPEPMGRRTCSCVISKRGRRS
jgi:hypothetical protein